METFLDRLGTGKKNEDLATVGELTVNGTTVFTLEDDFDHQKEYGKTRIPAGRYEIKLRCAGKMHESYLKRFFDMHKGMLHLQNVPNFEYVYIHCGNKVEDTNGCILVGSRKLNDKIVESTYAYKKIYPLIADALEKEKVFINIKD